MLFRSVLTGSKVADYYEKFVSANEGEVIDSTGMLKSTSGVVNVAEVGGVKYASLAEAVAKAKELGKTDINLIGSESFANATTIALGNVRLNVTSGMDVTLSGKLTLTGGNTAVHIIYVNGGKLTLDGVTVKDHTSTGNKGAIAVANKGSITLNNCELKNLKAERGALYLNGANGAFSISATNTKFTDNESTAFGGAVSTYGAITSTFAGCTFSGNVADTYGGAFAAYNASGSDSASTTFKDCVFANNTASTQGGGAAYLRGTVTISGSSFSGNSAATNSGAVHFYVTSATVTNTSFTDNTAGSGESAIRLANSGKLTLDGVTSTGNTSYDANISSGTLTLKGATKIGAIALGGKTVTVDASLSLADSTQPIGLVATAGATAIKGSISDTHDMFVVVNASGEIDTSLTMDASGKVVSAG